MTLEEARLQYGQVNTAIEQLLLGERLKILRVGSGSFARLYQYEDISLESLRAYRAELIDIINSLDTTTGLTFGKSLTIPLVVTKDRW